MTETKRTSEVSECKGLGSVRECKTRTSEVFTRLVLGSDRLCQRLVLGSVDG